MLEESDGDAAVAYCGAVLEKHHVFREHCQDVLDLLFKAESRPGRKRRRLVLEEAADSGLMGAAVGAVMNASVARESGPLAKL